ncbi:MAG: tetratricopeptide repeat protein [Gemmatimonadaceae bacterium]
MSWWSRIIGGSPDSEVRPHRVDYLSEALALERQGDYDAALTSYRLALREKPNDPRILQNMGIAFSKTGRLDESIRAYRRALELNPALSGAHYGVAFLLLKRGETDGAREHLEAFLANPPVGTDSERFVSHAQRKLDELNSAGADGRGEPE